MKTKYLFTLITSIIITAFCYSQETIVNIEYKYTLDPFSISDEDIYYYKDTNNLLNKFIGTWVYDDGTHYLKIVVTKHLHVSKGIDGLYNDNDFEDLLYIKTEYKLNGEEKYNTTGGMGGNTIEDSNTVEVIYYEPSLTSCYRRKSAFLKLTHFMNPSNTEQLIWTRTNIVTEGLSECPNGSNIDDSEFLIPANLALTKVE